MINEPMKDEPPEDDEEEMTLVSKTEPEELPEDDLEDEMPLVSFFYDHYMGVGGNQLCSSCSSCQRSFTFHLL